MLFPTELRARGRGNSDSKAFAAVPKIKSSPFSRYCVRTVSKCPLRSLFRKEQVSHELDEELNGFLEMAAEEKMKQGMSRKDALRAVRLERGNLDGAKEVVRSAGWESFVETLVQDIRYGLRMLRKSPGFTAVAVLTLALGIGASTIGFSIFYNLMFNAFAAKDASRLVVPTIHDEDVAGSSDGPSLTDFEEIRKQNNVFENVVAYITAGGLVLANEGPRTYQFWVSRVTSDAFDFYGVPALLGRGIEPVDGKPGAPGVFVISCDTWKQDFNDDPQIVGKHFVVDGEPRTLIGVMPPRFHAFGPGERIWVPQPQLRQTLRGGISKSTCWRA